MSNFYSLLPFAAEDLRQRRIIADAANVSWASAASAAYIYWNMTGVEISVYAQYAFSSQNIGLETDEYIKYSSREIDAGCVCAMPPHLRAKRGDRNFLRAQCGAASLSVDGPFFRENYPAGTRLADMEMGFEVNFSFRWNSMDIHTSATAGSIYLAAGDATPPGGTPVTLYRAPYGGYVFDPNETPNFDISISYLFG